MTALELIAASKETCKCRWAINANGDAIATDLGPGFNTPWNPIAERCGDTWKYPIIAIIAGQRCRLTAQGPITAAEEQWQEVAP